MQERRLAARYRYRCPVTVQYGDRGAFAADTTEVAVGGVGLVMAPDAIAALAQGGSILTPGDRVDVCLPVQEGVSGVPGPVLAGRVRQVRRLSQARYQVGVWFDGLDDAEVAALEDLVALARGAQGT